MAPGAVRDLPPHPVGQSNQDDARAGPARVVVDVLRGAGVATLNLPEDVQTRSTCQTFLVGTVGTAPPGALARICACAALAIFTGSCGQQSCSAMGCVDGIGLVVRAPGDVWSTGAYTIRLSYEKKVHVCEVVLQVPLSNTGAGLRQVPCTPPVSKLPSGLEFRPEVSECWTTDTGSQCEYDWNHWHIEGRLEATPGALRVEVLHDGSLRLDELRTLQYADYSPNGASCGPTCRQTQAEFSIQ